MAKSLADDQPAPSVQDDPFFHTAVTCPQDGTLVMVSGPRGAAILSGACGVCHKIVYGRSELAHQRGFFELDDPNKLQAPLKDDDAKS